MRKILKTTGAVLLALVLILSSAAFVSAKDLEVCYHCSGTGHFECPNCHNQVQVTCDGCGGSGGTKCDGEEGKGPCDNGYYVCPSCHGDGYARSGEGTVASDTPQNSCRYGTCNGTGKIECWKCHGKAWITCDRCNGTGKVECQNGNCIESRKVDWKCHYCMGAGYLLTNFWPGENDGVQNKPVPGDKIWANGKSTTYGGGSSSDQGNNNQGSDPGNNSQSGNNGSGGSNQGGNSGGNSQGGSGGNSGNSGSTTPRYDKNGANIGRDPSNGRDFVWFINVGTGEWDFNGHKITVQRNGKAASGTLDVHYSDRITIINHDNVPNVAIYITGANGFRARLNASGDGGVSVEDRDPAGSYVPFNVDLVIEGDENAAGDTFTVDFGGGHWNVAGTDITATVNGKAAAGKLSLTDHDIIQLNGRGDAPIQVRVYGENGFSAELELSGDGGTALGWIIGDYVLPPDLTFEVEAPASEPGPGQGRHTVDFGSGSWTIDGKEVYATIDGSRVSGAMDIEESETITLHGLDQDTMSVRVYADDGFSAGLSISGDSGVSLGRLEGNFALPDHLHFEVYRRGDGPRGPEGSNESDPNRFHIEFDKMSSEERAAYDKLSDEERNNVSEIIRNIVITAVPGGIDADLDKTIWDISKENGLSPGEDVSYYPIQFDGHYDIGFPVRVTVTLRPGELDGARDIHMYHVAESGELEYLGIADKTTYEDGSVETLSFYTRSFSDFFGSSVKLTKGAGGQEIINNVGSGFPVVPVVIGVVVVAAVVAVILAKKKKKTTA